MQVRESEPRAMLYDARALRCPRLPHARTNAPLFIHTHTTLFPYAKGTTTYYLCININHTFINQH